ncbi:MAG: hypothetical protein JWO06_794 [Bacteroidota bacterium]|nr:hypothetical protein [Bacteroidota bacterium]
MNSLKTQITGHFILYEVFKVATGEIVGELVIARDEPDHEQALKRELKVLAKELGFKVTELQSRALGKR